MMSALGARFATAVAWAVILLDCAQLGAWAQNTTEYTVYSTFIFARTGERTPQLLLDQDLRLTSYGAQQMYDMVC